MTSSNDIKKLMKQDVVELKFKICVYGHGADNTRSHSFCIADMPSGTSSQIGEMIFDIRTMTFKELRDKLQYNRSQDMDRRSLIFQEALSIMDRLPNLFNRPTEDLRKYFFGFVRKDNNELKIVGTEETQTVESFLGRYEFFARNLMLIPYSQLPLSVWCDVTCMKLLNV